MDNNQKLLKNSGLRITPTRRAVLSVLNSSKQPLDIATIYNELSKHHVDADQATIYRIIESFIDKGIITRIQFQEKKFFYEAIRSEHHHAVCSECGVIEDISNCRISEVEQEIEKTKGFIVKSHSLEFFGLCKNCQTV